MAAEAEKKCEAGWGGGCCARSPKSALLFLLLGIKSRQMLVSLLAIVCGLLLLLRSPIFLLESGRWRPGNGNVVFPQDHHLRLGTALMTGIHSNSSFLTPGVARNTSTCDLWRGRWIHDGSRPLYSGTQCGRWLSKSWMCRLDKHHNRSYERHRWQPHGCDLPAFDAAQLLHRMRNKTIAFVGDSLGRQQFQSLMCMLVGDSATSSSSLSRIVDVSRSYGLVSKGEGAHKFVASNTTLLFHWSATLGFEEPLGTTTKDAWAVHVDRVPAFLSRNAHRLDVVIVNTGHHWNRGKIHANRWVIHVDGAPANLKVEAARRIALRNCARWLDARRGTMRGFVRSLSPRHFRGGEWDSGGRCDDIRDVDVVEEEESSVDWIAREAVSDTSSVKLLDISYLSRARGDAHISSASMPSSAKQDCLHWCLPGVPDTWNEILYALLLATASDSNTNL